MKVYAQAFEGDNNFDSFDKRNKIGKNKCWGLARFES